MAMLALLQDPKYSYYISIRIAIRHVTVAIYHNILLHYISIYIITVMTTLCALYMHDHCVLCMVI